VWSGEAKIVRTVLLLFMDLKSTKYDNISLVYIMPEIAKTPHHTKPYLSLCRNTEMNKNTPVWQYKRYSLG
jgi:hypothetical protein